MTEKTMEEKVAAVLSSKAPATLKTLAAATGLTELEASKLLPADSRAYADGSKFDAVWSSACAWPSATFFLEHLGNVIEVSCKLAEGKHGMGYYNIFHGSPLGGHLKAVSSRFPSWDAKATSSRSSMKKANRCSRSMWAVRTIS